MEVRSVFPELYLCPWIFLQTAQMEGALAKWRVELAEEGGTLRERLNEVGRSARELRLSFGAWIGKPRLPISPS